MFNVQIHRSRAARQRRRARATFHRGTPRRVPRLDVLEQPTLLCEWAVCQARPLDFVRVSFLSRVFRSCLFPS